MGRIAQGLAFAAVFAGATARAQDAGTIPITTTSGEARALLLRGRALNETLAAHDARVFFQRAVASDPGFALGEYYLASTAPTTNEQAEHLTKAIALAPNASPGERLMILGLQARAHADRGLMLQLAESLVALYPRDARAHGVLGLVFAGQHDYVREIAEYEKAIALEPTYSIAYNQLGYAYRSLGDMKAAETAFRTYIALIPNDPNPYDSYGELLMKMGRFDESIIQYRKALAIDPHFGASRIGIAGDGMLAGRTADAIRELRAYYDNARDDSERRAALLTEAMIHVERGATDDAVRTMDRSRELARAMADTASMSADDVAAADILLEAGRVEAARDRYRGAHDLLAASGLAAAVKDDDALAASYDAARVALARHDLAGARKLAAAYHDGAAARKNDVRVRQAHALNGLIALAGKEFDRSLSELALADQEDPSIWYAMARAEAGRGNAVRASELSMRAAHMNVLPSLSYVFTRASIAAATRSATSGTGRERRR
jgi:tetratricopeptide (TPR) repeat protein